MRMVHTIVAPALAAVALAGVLVVPTVTAQPGPRGAGRDRCEAVLPRQSVDPIVARYRDRLRTAREGVAREERALQYLLIAENSTRAALDAQIAKTTEARNAFTRARLDLLWDLRPAIPAPDRGLAFRCVERLLLRNR